jgi:hypothetical protein
LQQWGEINDGDPVRVQDSLEVAILWQLDELSNEAVNRYALSVGINEILRFQRRKSDIGQGKSARILPAMAAPLRNAPSIGEPQHQSPPIPTIDRWSHRQFSVSGFCA